jgi:hypothetical protein
MCGGAYGGCGSCGNCGFGAGGAGGAGRMHAHHRAQGPTRVAHLPHGYMQEQMDGRDAPPSGTYAYPYYTLRAPRDFLLNNPPTIGP